MFLIPSFTKAWDALQAERGSGSISVRLGLRLPAPRAADALAEAAH